MHGVCGMFDDIPLYEYVLYDGRTARETVQVELWSSGPMIWTQLEVSDGNVFQWKYEEGVLVTPWDPSDPHAKPEYLQGHVPHAPLGTETGSPTCAQEVRDEG